MAEHIHESCGWDIDAWYIPRMTGFHQWTLSRFSEEYEHKAVRRSDPR